MKPDTLLAQTAGENHPQKVKVDLLCEVGRALLLYCTVQNDPVCWAWGRISPSFFFLDSVVAATAWQECLCLQVPVLTVLLSLRTTDGSGFLVRGISSQKGLSVGKTHTQRWSSASSLSVKGTLEGLILPSHSPSSCCPRWEPAPSTPFHAVPPS